MIVPESNPFNEPDNEEYTNKAQKAKIQVINYTNKNTPIYSGGTDENGNDMVIEDL